MIASRAFDTEALANERDFAESDRDVADILHIGEPNATDLQVVGGDCQFAICPFDVETVCAVHAKQAVADERRIAGADHRIVA